MFNKISKSNTIYTKKRRSGLIESYYRFKVVANHEENVFDFIRLLDKGKPTPFDKIYYQGEISDYANYGSINVNDKFGNVHIKFNLDDGLTNKLPVQILRGAKGWGSVYGQSQLYYSLIYRQPLPNEYELFFIKPTVSVEHLAKLKRGLFDNEIKLFLNS
jgi:hypothetical protein